MDRERSLTTIRELRRRGEHLSAYDEAITALDSFPNDLELQYEAVLALVRSGATGTAVAQLERFGIERAVAARGGPGLLEDVGALRARVAKDHALTASGESRRVRAELAARAYEFVYRRVNRPYSCINAATLWLLAGNPDRAAQLAHDALDLARGAQADETTSPYWLAATEAEAALVLGDVGGARDALVRAERCAPGDYAARASTRRQLRLICEVRGLDDSVLGVLQTPQVIHFCGHRISPQGSGGRFPASSERTVADAIEQHLEERSIGFGYGSLASGADILVAEALLARGAEVHVVLPFSIDEFVAVSVSGAGDEWVRRFRRCIGGASSVSYSTEGEYLNDPGLFSHCSRVAMGDALIRAGFLDTEVEQLAVWDGAPPVGIAGTAVDVGAWRSTGHDTTVIDSFGDPDPGPRAPAHPANPRSVRAMLFADVSGYSTLSDSQLPAFLDDLIAPFAGVLRRFDDHVCYRNSWGDAIYAVFDSVSAAAECALMLQATMRGTDLSAAGLPIGLGLRIAVHAGPVFEREDPIREELNFYGAEVTRAARLEPRTPVGEVYVTHEFAALITLDGSRSISCQYVGRLPSAKSYGTFPMYVLKQLTESIRR